MKFLFNPLAAILLLGNAVAYAAGSVSNVTITRTAADNLGHVFVYFSSAVGGTPPGCATIGTGMVIDGSTNAGRALAAIVLSWYALGKTISGTGTGDCGLVRGYESAASFYSSN